MKRIEERLDGNASLLEHADQSTDLQLTVIRHDASCRAATHHEMTASLTYDDESEPLQSAHDFGAGYAR